MPGKRRIGVLGGTFDPIHLGHLIIGEEARARLDLAEVVFVPARDPWRKARRDLAHVSDRLAMVNMAVEGNPAFSVSTVDLNREGPSYSVDTLMDIQEEKGREAELYLILGFDALADVPYWHEPARLASLAHLVAARRFGIEVDWPALEHAIPSAREHITLLDMPLVIISSTEIRRRVAEGESIRYWVPARVEAYIHEHGLYRAT